MFDFTKVKRLQGIQAYESQVIAAGDLRVIIINLWGRFGLEQTWIQCSTENASIFSTVALS